MKHIFSICLMAAVMLAFNANAQLKVTSATGKVKMGLETPVGVSQDNNDVLSAHIFGPNGDYRANSKMAFGDFGSYERWSWNVFVGEYRDYDSDRLWLHGKLGFYLTKGRGDDVVAYYDINSGNNFHFNCDVFAYGVMLSSDARFKTNIKPISSALQQLKQLEGVSYNLLPHVLNKANGSVAPSATQKASGEMTAKERKDQALFEQQNKEAGQPGAKRLGLIAQEVQKVFPELVKSDSSNYLYVDYIGLIPVMIEGIKEQEAIIEAQDDKIKELESRLNNVEGKLSGMLNEHTDNGTATENSAYSYLYQNNPNPFTASTQISYFLASGVKTAAIHIFDMQGNMIKTILLKGTGKGQTAINGSELKAGMYIYNLVTDGQEADMKRMTLIK